MLKIQPVKTPHKCWTPSQRLFGKYAIVALAHAGRRFGDKLLSDQKQWAALYTVPYRARWLAVKLTSPTTQAQGGPTKPLQP